MADLHRQLAGLLGNATVRKLVAIKVTASDGNGGSVSDTFDIVVSAANNPPTVATAIQNQTATAGTEFRYTVSSSAFTDADGDALTYTAAKGDGNALPGWLSFATSSRAFSGTPLSADTVAVKVTASDSSGGSVSDTFNIVVSAANNPPTVATAIQNQTATAGTEFRFTDADGDALTYTAANTVPADAFNDADSGDTLTYSAANNPPTVATAIQNQTATAGTEFRYTVSSSAFTDADGDALTYTAAKGDGNAARGPSRERHRPQAWLRSR